MRAGGPLGFDSTGHSQARCIKVLLHKLPQHAVVTVRLPVELLPLLQDDMEWCSEGHVPVTHAGSSEALSRHTAMLLCHHATEEECVCQRPSFFLTRSACCHAEICKPSGPDPVKTFGAKTFATLPQEISRFNALSRHYFAICPNGTRVNGENSRARQLVRQRSVTRTLSHAAPLSRAFLAL